MTLLCGENLILGLYTLGFGPLLWALLCGIKSSRFDIHYSDVGRFFVRVLLTDRKSLHKFYLVIVYGAAQDCDEESFLATLSDLCVDQSIPLLIGGDFNILRFHSDKNKVVNNKRYMDMFNYVINIHALRELHMVGGAYTWSNNQEDPTLEKLDRVLINDKWELTFPLTSVRKLPRAVSDHNPLIMDIGENCEQRSKEFRFETSWLSLPEFMRRVDLAWQTQGLCQR